MRKPSTGTALAVLGLLTLVVGASHTAAWPRSPSVSVEVSKSLPTWDVPTPDLTIRANTKHAEGLWLGCSIRDRKTGRILKDLPPMQVPSSGSGEWTVPAGLEGQQIVVKLWKGIKKQPKAPGGVAMVGEVASTGWLLLSPYTL